MKELIILTLLVAVAALSVAGARMIGKNIVDEQMDRWKKLEETTGTAAKNDLSEVVVTASDAL